MNQWARALTPEDIDDLVDAYGAAPGSMVGFAFLMMNPVSNLTKYTIDLIDVLDDDAKLLNFLRMERWIADRPDHPGEVVRQWFKDLYQDNKLIKNELVLGGRTVDLAQHHDARAQHLRDRRHGHPGVVLAGRAANISAPTTTPRSPCPAGTSARSSAARRRRSSRRRWPTGSRRAATDRGSCLVGGTP